MENAILYAGTDELNTIKEHVMEQTGYQERNAELLKEEARLEKLLTGKERELSEEIESTLKKRKAEIMSSYEEQLNTFGNRRKKIKARKEKEKGIKVSERIKEETEELRKANESLQINIKANLKKNKTPGFCNSSLFYAMFLPKTMGEFCIMACSVLFVFFALPLGIYRLFLAKHVGVWALALVYVADLFLFGGLYLLVNNKVKEKHREVLTENRRLRQEREKNRKEIHSIQRQIRQDTDESAYGLERYDDELNEVEAEIRRIAEEEKEELTKFETGTSMEIAADIKNRYQEELDALRAKVQEVSEEQKRVEEKVKELSLMLSKQYEIYLGKDMLTVAKLDRLIKRIETKEASNIGEALALERESK